jgi:hypothetical protein
MPYLIREKIVVLIGTVLVFAIYWLLAFGLSAKFSLGVVARWCLFTGLYLVAIVTLVCGIFFWISMDAGPALLRGSPAEPLLPILAVIGESALEGINAFLAGVEQFGDRLARRLLELSGKLGSSLPWRHWRSAKSRRT